MHCIVADFGARRTIEYVLHSCDNEQRPEAASMIHDQSCVGREYEL